jgi:Pyridoxal-phosphate dependent enzyme
MHNSGGIVVSNRTMRRLCHVFSSPCRRSSSLIRLETAGSTLFRGNYHVPQHKIKRNSNNLRSRMISQDLFSRWFTADTDDTVATTDVVPKDNDDGDTNDSNTESFSTLIEPNTKSHSQKTLDNLPITFADISRAEVAIRGGVKRTTCEKSHFISELCGTNVYFKNEFRQFTGSFKERGARNAILKLIREKGSALRGVIAASAGNHALAIAYHGQLLGVPVTVVMPTTAPLAKVDKCRVSSQ